MPISYKRVKKSIEKHKRKRKERGKVAISKANKTYMVKILNGIHDHGREV